MSWTKFRDKYLFAINFSIMIGAILYTVRKDWEWHPVVVLLLVLSLIFPAVQNGEKRILHYVGKFNSMVLLTSFYYLFFSPFSFIYRAFFRNRSFSRRPAGLIPKNEISPFDRPF